MRDDRRRLPIDYVKKREEEREKKKNREREKRKKRRKRKMCKTDYLCKIS